MSDKSKEGTVYLVPGVTDAARLVRGSAMALFVPGVEAYANDSVSETIMIRGLEGEAVSAKSHGAEVGRLYNLATRFMHQSPAVMNYGASGVTPGIQGMPSLQDVTFFRALDNAYGEGSTQALESYTVLIFSLDQSIPYPSTP